MWVEKDKIRPVRDEISLWRIDCAYLIPDGTKYPLDGSSTHIISLTGKMIKTSSCMTEGGPGS